MFSYKLGLVIVTVIGIQVVLVFLARPSILGFAGTIASSTPAFSHAVKIAPVNKSLVHDRWIVTTTISSPTSDVRKLCAVPGWKVVVVADTKTPKDWSSPPCVFLSVENQLELGYNILQQIPFKTYARKNIGYMFAIQHGAKFIYDTDDDNHPTDNLKSFIYTPTYTGLVYDTAKVVGRSVINVYAHFGQPSIWPRGFPLDQVGAPPFRSYKSCNMKTPVVQQGVVNGDPDVDAIFRLTRKNHRKVIDVAFSNSPPVALPPHLLCPYNSQNTFHTYEAFLWLLIPKSVEMRITDIWRGYWAQGLLPLVGTTVAFMPPRAYQKRSAHNYIADAKQEEKLYYQTPDVVKFLKSWKCSYSDIYVCSVKLIEHFVVQNFMKPAEIGLVKAWVQDLKAVGYKAPVMLNSPLKDICKSQSRPKTFTPIEQKTSFAHTPLLGKYNLSRS